MSFAGAQYRSLIPNMDTSHIKLVKDTGNHFFLEKKVCNGTDVAFVNRDGKFMNAQTDKRVAWGSFSATASCWALEPAIECKDRNGRPFDPRVHYNVRSRIGDGTRYLRHSTFMLFNHAKYEGNPIKDDWCWRMV